MVPDMRTKHPQNVEATTANSAAPFPVVSAKRAAIALTASGLAALGSMVGWTSLLVLTRVNFSFLAIPVAALVGWTMRRAGGRGDKRFALMASVFTLAACHFGAGFAARILEARLLGTSALELIYGATPGDIFMAVSVNVCDLAFYALAACVAWRQVSPPVLASDEKVSELPRGRIGQVL